MLLPESSMLAVDLPTPLLTLPTIRPSSSTLTLAPDMQGADGGLAGSVQFRRTAFPAASAAYTALSGEQHLPCQQSAAGASDVPGVAAKATTTAVAASAANACYAANEAEGRRQAGGRGCGTKLGAPRSWQCWSCSGTASCQKGLLRLGHSVRGVRAA